MSGLFERQASAMWWGRDGQRKTGVSNLEPSRGRTIERVMVQTIRSNNHLTCPEEARQTEHKTDPRPRVRLHDMKNRHYCLLSGGNRQCDPVTTAKAGWGRAASSSGLSCISYKQCLVLVTVGRDPTRACVPTLQPCLLCDWHLVRSFGQSIRVPSHYAFSTDELR